MLTAFGLAGVMTVVMNRAHFRQFSATTTATSGENHRTQLKRRKGGKPFWLETRWLVSSPTGVSYRISSLHYLLHFLNKPILPTSQIRPTQPNKQFHPHQPPDSHDIFKFSLLFSFFPSSISGISNCTILTAFLAIESITAAENATKSTATPVTAALTSTATSKPKQLPSTEAKNKRQINQFVRTAGANIATNDGTEPQSIDRVQAQSFPLQLTHSIYSQQPIYARRTTLKPEPQVIDEEQELERQQNEVNSHT